MMEQRSFEVRFLEGKVRRMEREIAKLLEQGERLLDKTLELGTENAKLREERDTYRDLVGCMVHPDIPDQLYAENVKLRELVRDMFRDFANADNELKRDRGRTFMAVTRYAPRMHELGVDDG